MDIKKDLEYVKKEQKQIYILMGIDNLLSWDQSVNLPEDASRTRAEQISLIQSKIHEIKSSKKLFSKLKSLSKKKLKKEDEIIIKKFYRIVSKARKIPPTLIKDLSKEEVLGNRSWEKARIKDNFRIFEPHLEKLVKLKRKEAKFIGLPGHPYNSLLDKFEEGMTVEKLKEEFGILKIGLLEILKKIKSSKGYKNHPKEISFKKFSNENQVKLDRDVMERIGLKKSFSRIDFSTHPFTTRIGDDDVRITTAIRKNPLFSFNSTIHESGHGLYEANMPKEYRYTFVCDAPSYGLHESQSRIWENNIGLSKPFWKFYSKKFNESLRTKYSSDKFYNFVNKIEDNPIRIEADEIHYILHIILRFEMELALIEGKIKVRDLPKIWNAKVKEYFGIKVKNDSEGVLQDTHWSSGLFGYFPTYAIGTIYATQLYNQMKKEIKDLDNDLEKGDFSKISNWLKEKVHKKGATLTAEGIIKELTGEGLNSKIFLDYLNEKYSKIYGYKI